MTESDVQTARQPQPSPAVEERSLGVAFLTVLGIAGLGVLLHLVANEWFLTWGGLVASGVWISACGRGVGRSLFAAAIRFGVGFLYFSPIMGFAWKILLTREQRLDLLREYSDATCIYALHALALTVVLVTGFLAHLALRKRSTAPSDHPSRLGPSLVAAVVFYLLAWGPLVGTLRTLELDKTESRLISQSIYYATWPHQWLARNVGPYKTYSRFWGNMVAR